MSADAKSRSIDPLLDAGLLYRPIPGSRALDAGETLAEVTTNYSGTRRPLGPASDIGAHEGTGSFSIPTGVRVVK
jgi:hypothetical protein